MNLTNKRAVFISYILFFLHLSAFMLRLQGSIYGIHLIKG